MLLHAAMMWFTAGVYHDGSWSALFCTGALRPQPPSLSGENTYLFQNATGYDGQFYHYMAHDPMPRGEMLRYMDHPRVRYRRILVPLSAHLLALGQTRWIDASFFAVLLAGVGAGGYWLALWFTHRGLPAGLGVCFALLPPVLVAANRATVDAWLAALTVAYLLLYVRQGWRLYAVLVCAALSRETGILLIAGHGLYCLTARRWKDAVTYGSAALPALLWWRYVATQAPHTSAELSGWTYGFPFSGLVGQLAFRAGESVSHPLLHVFDTVCLLLTLSILIHIMWRLVRSPKGIFTCHLAGWLILSIVLASLSPALARAYWGSAFSYARSLGPMFLLWGLQPQVNWRLTGGAVSLLSLRILIDIILDSGVRNL